MSFKTIFAAIFGIIAFSFLIGMCKTCKAKEKSEVTEQPAVDKDGNPTTRPGKAKATAPVTPPQTFRIVYYGEKKKDGTRDVTYTSNEIKTNWEGYISDDIPAWDFEAAVGDTIFVTTPGYYTKVNRIDVWHEAQTTRRIGGQPNPPFPDRGKGVIKVSAAQ